jgi:hypothetical protein
MRHSGDSVARVCGKLEYGLFAHICCGRLYASNISLIG